MDLEVLANQRFLEGREDKQLREIGLGKYERQQKLNRLVFESKIKGLVNLCDDASNTTNDYSAVGPAKVEQL